MSDAFPYVIQVVRLTADGKKLQNFNAADMRDAIRIADREQGKQYVFSVDILVRISSWSKAVNVSTDGSVAHAGWNRHGSENGVTGGRNVVRTRV